MYICISDIVHERRHHIEGIGRAHVQIVGIELWPGLREIVGGKFLTPVGGPLAAGSPPQAPPRRPVACRAISGPAISFLAYAPTRDMSSLSIMPVQPAKPAASCWLDFTANQAVKACCESLCRYSARPPSPPDEAVNAEA